MMTDIPGATSPTYVPVVGDIGFVLQCTVTATNANGSASAISAPTMTIIAASGDALNLGLNLTVDSVPVGA